MSQFHHRILIFLGILCIIAPEYLHANFGMNNRFDSFPMFTTLDPQYFLYTREKNILKGWPVNIDEPERVSLSLSPFGQNATRARTICNDNIEIGELNGRWDLLTLLFGCLPEGKRLPCLLERARQGIFPDLPPGTVIDNPDYIDSNQQVGFVRIPICYRKRGLRFQLEAQIVGDFGLQIHGGVVDICNTASKFEFFRDSVYPTDNTDCIDFPDPCDINKYLVDEFCPIMKEIGLDISNYHKLSCDDFRFFLYWRHAHLVNADRDESWARFLVIPFFRVGGMAGSGKPAVPNEAFSVPFGNNGSNMAGVNFGINFDFADTVEIGGEVGYSHFFEKTFCDYRVPNSCFQSGIYPFTTDVTIKPGDTWYFATKLAAEHFYDRWSFWFQYVIIEHLDDDIKLICCDPAFVPKALEDISTWKTQFLNMALNYDYSPNIGIGFLWQQPVAWRNAPKCTTVMFTFYANF